MSDEIKVRRRKLKEYQTDPHNANAGNPRGQHFIESSVGQTGIGRSLVSDAHDTFVAGNTTAEVLAAAGFEDVIEIETDGKAIIVHKRTNFDLTDPDPNNPARQYAYYDNRASDFNTYDPAVLQADALAGIDMTQFFFPDELTALLGAVDTPLDFGDDGQGDELPDEDEPLTRHDIPDALWPTDNEWEIPTLDIELQANAVDLPFVTWGVGRAARSKEMRGTWGFYTEDARYTALWSDPSPVPNSGCVNAVEPNFSCYGQTPRALALHRIYQKRYIARVWQMFGVRIFVDMNVNDRHFDLNMLGVPSGWKAYCTRGYNERTDYIEAQHTIACERAGTSSILFVIYGGGKLVEATAKKLNAVHVREQEKITDVALAEMEKRVHETPDAIDNQPDSL